MNGKRKAFEIVKDDADFLELNLDYMRKINFVHRQ